MLAWIPYGPTFPEPEPGQDRRFVEPTCRHDPPIQPVCAVTPLTYNCDGMNRLVPRWMRPVKAFSGLLTESHSRGKPRLYPWLGLAHHHKRREQRSRAGMWKCPECINEFSAPPWLRSADRRRLSGRQRWRKLREFRSGGGASCRSVCRRAESRWRATMAGSR